MWRRLHLQNGPEQRDLTSMSLGANAHDGGNTPLSKEYKIEELELSIYDIYRQD